MAKAKQDLVDEFIRLLNNSPQRGFHLLLYLGATIVHWTFGTSSPAAMARGPGAHPLFAKTLHTHSHRPGTMLRCFHDFKTIFKHKKTDHVWT